MDHIGFNSLIVRYHPYLKKIAEKYEDKYGETLIERVRSEAKGCYRDLVFKIIENVINDFVDEEDDEEKE